MNATDFDQAILVRNIKSGQARPYADTIEDVEITFTGRNISTRPDRPLVVGCHPQSDRVKSIAKVLVRNFVDEVTHPLDVRLDHIECVRKEPGSSTWLVRIVTPYCD